MAMQTEDIVFDEHKKHWTNLSAEGARSLLTSDEVVTSNVPEFYDALANDAGRDFKFTRFVLKYTPTLQDGEAHDLCRRLMLQRIREFAPQMSDATQEFVEFVLSKLNEVGDHDLVEDIFGRAAARFTARLAGIDARINPEIQFTMLASLKRFSTMNEEARLAYEEARERYPDENEGQTGARLVMAAMGYGPLVGAMTESFHAVVSKFPGKPLNKISWPEIFSRTGVPVVGRKVEQSDTELLGSVNESQKLIEVNLSHFENGDTVGANPDIFGMKDHGCLGKGMTINLWRQICRGMSSIDKSIEVLEYAPSRHAFLNIPEKIIVRISE